MSERETPEPREASPPTSDEVREIRAIHARENANGSTAWSNWYAMNIQRELLLALLTQKEAEIERLNAQARVAFTTGMETYRRLSAAESRIAADGRELEAARRVVDLVCAKDAHDLPHCICAWHEALRFACIRANNARAALKEKP